MCQALHSLATVLATVSVEPNSRCPGDGVGAVNGWFLLGVLTGITATVVGIVLVLRLYTWRADRKLAEPYDPDATIVIPRIQER